MEKHSGQQHHQKAGEPADDAQASLVPRSGGQEEKKHIEKSAERPGQ